MKVLNILWGYSTGGIAKCFLTYNRMGEACSGIEVRSICINIESRHDDISALSVNGVELIQIKNPFDLTWVSKVGSLLKLNQPDVIFCHGFNGPVIVWIAKKLYGIHTPMICTFHGRYQPPTYLKRLLSPIYNALQILLYRHSAARVITVENQSLEYLAGHGISRKKLSVVNNGIPDIRSADNSAVQPKNDVIQLCTISRLDPIKGIDLLIESIPTVLAATNVRFKLYIIGDGPENERLRRITKELHLEGIIEFTGHRSNVAEWLQRADIFLLPSLSECHSISLLEAMRAGKAIIATEVGGNTESIRNGTDGLIVQPGSPTAISTALIELLNHAEAREKFGQNARKRYLEHFTEEKMLTNLAQVFQSLSTVNQTNRVRENGVGKTNLQYS